MSVLSVVSATMYCLLILINKQSVTRSPPKEKGEWICLCRVNNNSTEASLTAILLSICS